MKRTTGMMYGIVLAEGMAFSRGELDSLLGLAEQGIAHLSSLQAAIVADPPPKR